MPKIMPCLWFDGQAEEAARLYVDVFGDGEIRSVDPMVVRFRLHDQELMGLNGGPQFKFNEALSLTVDCVDQAEVDHYWERLTADGGEESMCGWLKDKFGLSWQIVPQALPRLLGSPDRAAAGRAMQAMLGMRKLDVAALERAAAGG